jgi:hypothetical protein
MAWLSQFLLGRPGNEYSFDVNPEAMQLGISNIEALQNNLAGDLKQSVMKVRVPAIRVNSNFLSFAQRNQFDSLVGIVDTFLSFQTRDDWQVTDELVTVIDATHVQIANSSSTRLSKILTAYGFASIITILTPWKTGTVAGQLYGSGGFGVGGYGSPPESFDPGAVTYDDQTRIVTFTNPLPDVTASVLVSYLYKGWLVKLKQFDHKAQGGWQDRFQYDFELIGA